MANPLSNKIKGYVFRDKHPERLNRIFAVVWEAAKYVKVYSTAGRISRISKKRLFKRYDVTDVLVNTNTDFKPRLQEISNG